LGSHASISVMGGELVSSSAHRGLNAHFREHGFHINQVVIEDLPCHIEELEYGLVADGVVNVRPVFASDDDIPDSEYGKLLRQGALLYSKAGAKVVDAGFAIAKFVQHGNAQRMSKRLEEFRLEPAQVGHEVII